MNVLTISDRFLWSTHFNSLIPMRIWKAVIYKFGWFRAVLPDSPALHEFCPTIPFKLCFWTSRNFPYCCDWFTTNAIDILKKEAHVVMDTLYHSIIDLYSICGISDLKKVYLTVKISFNILFHVTYFCIYLTSLCLSWAPMVIVNFISIISVSKTVLLRSCIFLLLTFFYQSILLIWKKNEDPGQSRPSVPLGFL